MDDRNRMFTFQLCKHFVESRGRINSSGRSWLENSARSCPYRLLEFMLFLSHSRLIRDWFLELDHEVVLAHYFVASTFTFLTKVFFYMQSFQARACIVTTISSVLFSSHSFQSTVRESSSSLYSVGPWVANSVIQCTTNKSIRTSYKNVSLFILLLQCSGTSMSYIYILLSGYYVALYRWNLVSRITLC